MSDACSVQCGGRCCQRFPVNMSPARMGERYLELTAWRDSGGALEPWMRDHIFISEMLVPLHEEADERPAYTCRHFDAAAGLCTAYADRPAMCSDYPSYGDPARGCDHCGYHAPSTPDIVHLTRAAA